MNKLIVALLGGAAFCALTSVRAVAGDAPARHVTALHRGTAVNKTMVHDPVGYHVTYTFAVSTAVPASDLHQAAPLALTFYKWSSSAECSNPRQKIKAPRKSVYGRVRGATETYSLGCTAPTVFYGDIYTLKDPAGEGQTDAFVSTLYGWFKNAGLKYKGTLHLDVSVAIRTE
jgi:hypothetical protein